MTTLSITLTSACSGGGHLELAVRVNAGPVRTIRTTADQVMAALDEDGRDDLVAGILRIYGLGKTRAQVRAGLTTGIEVVI